MRILIIRPGAVGDALLALPVIQALRTHYTNPRIIFVGNAAVLPLMLASGLVEEVSDYEDTRWSALFSVEAQFIASNLIAPSSVDLAICWLRDPDGIVERNLRAACVLQVIVAPGRPPEGKRVHIVDYLAQTVGMSRDDGQIFTINAGGYGENLPIIYDLAVHPGSGGARKCWPASSFAAVIQRLCERERHVLLLGGPADHERIDAIRRALTCAPAILLAAPLLEVARALRQCRSYLGNDSGVTHLAAMLGVPTIALFSASDPAVWHPMGPSVEVLYAPRWEQMTIDRVLARVICS